MTDTGVEVVGEEDPKHETFMDIEAWNPRVTLP